MTRITQDWKTKAALAMNPGISPARLQREGPYRHASEKAIILSVAKALKTEFEQGRSTRTSR